MKQILIVVVVALVFAFSAPYAAAQLQQSGGGGSTLSGITLGGNAVTARSTGELDVNLGRVNGAAVDTGNGTAGSGTQRVTIASDNTPFNVNSVQSGTWTVQPGNTANTTAWKVTGTGGTFPATQSGSWSVALNAGAALIGSVVPSNTCGTTAFDSGMTENVATGAGSDLTTTATCVDALFLSNTSGSQVNVTVKDKSGTPKTYVATFALPANSNLILPLRRMKFTGGITVIAGTSSAVNAQVVGYQ